MNTNLAFLNWLLLLWSYLADSNYIPTQIASEQHYSWCTLGFVRAVATSPVICEALSSQKWIDLLLKILEEEKPSQPTKNIIKQVRGHCMGSFQGLYRNYSDHRVHVEYMYVIYSFSCSLYVKKTSCPLVGMINTNDSNLTKWRILQYFL